MARVNITIPDELLDRARAVGLNVSASAARGLAEELDRLAARQQLVRYLAELDEELGPVRAEEAAAAATWAADAFGPAPTTPTMRTAKAPQIRGISAPVRRARTAKKAGSQVA